MSQNMSSTSADYERARDNYERLVETNTNAALEMNKQAMQKSLAAQKAGNAAAIREQLKRKDELKKTDTYSEALRKGSRAAEGEARAAASQSQQAARQAGMSKAQAAEMGANAANQGRMASLGQQVSQALQAKQAEENMINNSVNNIANISQQQGANVGNLIMGGANNAMGALSQQTGQAGALTQMAQAEGQNKWNRSWNNMGRGMGMAGSFLGSLTSDKNLKDYKKNNDELEDKWASIDKILDNHKKHDYKSLVIMTKENR